MAKEQLLSRLTRTLMLGAELDAEQIAALIQQDLHLQIAFPSFPLESALGHTACCVVQKSWLDQLHNGSATCLYEGRTPFRETSTTNAVSPLPSTGTSKSGEEVNVFVNVISKTNPLQQDNWTKARVFGPSEQHAHLKATQPTRKAYTTLTLLPTNNEWNLTGEDYIRELLAADGGDDLKTEESIDTDGAPNYKEFQPILESDDFASDHNRRPPNVSGMDNDDTCHNIYNQNQKLIEHVLDVIYPTTLRYRVVHPSHDDSQSTPRLVLIKKSQLSEAQPMPANIAAATAIIESDRAHYCLSPHRLGGATGLTTLQDLLRFNPGNLNNSLKKGFLVFQLLKAVKGLHRHGIIHGNLNPSSIYIDENLWITLTGIKCSVPYSRDNLSHHKQELNPGKSIEWSIAKEIHEESTVMRWVKGEISNFTYLMILNHAAGRRQGDPNVHPIFPWVTDFTGSEVHHNWRDFSKTKFRLNKGDEQLDVTFDGPIPHHITDILSDITYYVYMARQIPIPVLCQFVRSKYEANEYPSSIRRLYEWTPDECIPEFYTDPNIFKSIHADMPDMALPAWAKTPEEFIRIHRDALESDYVSKHLHEWIDLTFGYKLSGPNAIEAKNVALSLCPGQSAFMKHGIIQLFTDLHPQRVCNWSLSKTDFFNAQAKKQTILEKASKSIKRRSLYRPQNDRSQFVDKVSDLLFRPAGPTRSKSLRQQPGSRPGTVAINNGNQERELGNSAPSSSLPSTNGLLSPMNVIIQDTNLALVSTRPEALVQLIQSEPIELSKELGQIAFIEELDHFEKTFQFGSKYHFMNSEAAKARILSDAPTLETGDSTLREKDSFEYMQSWDVYCLGEVFKQIYLAEDIPNNSIAMALKPGITVSELTKSQRIPIAVSGTITAMLNNDWKSRPKIEDILRKSIPALSLQSPTISAFIPTLITEIYDFLAMFNVSPVDVQATLASKCIDRICTFEDETFEIVLPVFVYLFTNEATRVHALDFLPKLGQRLGIKRTKMFLLKPIIALFESSKPILPYQVFSAPIYSEFLRRFGTSTFLKQLFPYYLDSLIVDYGLQESVSDAKSSVSLQSRPLGGIGAPSVSSIVLDEEPARNSNQDSIPKLGKVASDAFVGICRSIGPILTSKHVMRPFSRLAFKDPLLLPLLKETLSGIAQEFGSTFALVQFSHIMHLIDSASMNFTTRTSNTLGNLLGMLGSLVPHMYDTQLVTELRNGGSDLIYRLIEPNLSKRASRSNSLDNPRLAVSRTTMDFILHLSYSLSRSDWEKHIAPILQKYFSGFGPEIDEMSTKTASPMDVKRNEQMMYAYGQLCSCVGQEAMQSMIPASDAIERLIAARLASKEFGNSPLRSLGSITAQGKFVTTSASNYWQQQKSQQARDLANARKAPFSTKDLWSATSAGMSKALSLFETAKIRPASVTSGGSQGSGGSGEGGGAGPLASAASALMSASTSTSVNTMASVNTSTAIPASSLPVGSKESIAGERASEVLFYNQESVKLPAEILPSGSLSPILGAAPAKRTRQNFGSPGKAKTAARLEQLSNWNRFLSTNQEEMAKSMQFAFNDWKLQGLEGHTSGIRVIGANEYQRILATGSKDRTVKLWSLDIHKAIESPELTEAATGCLMTYNGHRRGAVYDVHFTTGGGSFGTGDIVASCDGQIHLWEPETGKTMHQFSTGKASVVTMAPIHHSRCIVAGHVDNSLSFLDSHTHLNLHNWRTTSQLGLSIKALTISPAETLIATGFSNGTVSLLESRTGTLVGNWRASDNEITQMKFYTNDILITSAPADHRVCIWNVHTLSLIKSIRGTSEIVSLEIFKDEIITMHHSNLISFTPINDDSLAYTSKFKSSAIRSSISCISVLPMNQLLVLGCIEGDLYLYS